VFVLAEVFKRWVKSERVEPIDVAVECWNKATIAHAMFVKNLISFQLATEAIQVSTFFGVAWIAIVVKLICQLYPEEQR